MPMFDGRDAAWLQNAATRLAAGELVAFPTETVYGLGARADDDVAVGRIFAAKGRPADHPLIVHVPDLAAASCFADLSAPVAQSLAARFWPGPLTLIVPRHPAVGAAAAGGQSTIGLRVPAHPVAIALLTACAALGVPGLAGPSANRFGRISPTTAQHVLDDFGPDLTVIDGGACARGIESTIVDCSSSNGPTLLRPGALARGDIEQVLGQALHDRQSNSPRASGTLEAHYAPKARLRLMTSAELGAAMSILAGSTPPQGLAVYSRTVRKVEPGIDLRLMPGRADQTAHELFAILREFDARGARLIWVESPPPSPDWDAVRDRLQRAAAA